MSGNKARDAERRAEARARHESAAHQLAEAAMGGLSLQTLLSQAVQLVKDALPADYSSVFEYDREADSAHRVVFTGPDQPHDTVSTKSGIPAWVFRHRETRAIEQVLPEDLNDMPFLRRSGFTSILVTPIRGETHSYGALTAGNREPRRWTDDEREFIELMAGTLWSAIERHPFDGAEADK